MTARRRQPRKPKRVAAVAVARSTSRSPEKTSPVTPRSMPVGQGQSTSFVVDEDGENRRIRNKTRARSPSRSKSPGPGTSGRTPRARSSTNRVLSDSLGLGGGSNYRFFPIQSVESPKDSLFNFSRKSETFKKPRKARRLSPEVKVEIKTESESEPEELIDVEVEVESEPRRSRPRPPPPLTKRARATPAPRVVVATIPFHQLQDNNIDTTTTTKAQDSAHASHTNYSDADATVEIGEVDETEMTMEDEIRLQIDSDSSEYSKLTNHNVTGNSITLSSSQLEKCASFTEFQDGLNFRESDPGVGIASFDTYENTITGYLRIAPRTLKPMTISQNVRIVCGVVLWMLEGEATLRSTQYKTINGIKTLAGKVLRSGSCILVPPCTPYMLENKSALIPVVIGYTMTSAAA